VRLLKEGSGVTGSRVGGVLPRGMRPGTSIVNDASANPGPSTGVC
jgi:prolyl-tRNA editing enzyme YbaK/EbsC (Cys-tRNA(Pro) deacylase)